MANEQDIENIIKLLDEKTEGGRSRIRVSVTGAQPEGSVQEQYHHGRCDVGSPWATGTVGNFECGD